MKSNTVPDLTVSGWSFLSLSGGEADGADTTIQTGTVLRAMATVGTVITGGYRTRLADMDDRPWSRLRLNFAEYFADEGRGTTLAQEQLAHGGARETVVLGFDALRAPVGGLISYSARVPG